MPTISTLELCAGAGGQAIGLEKAGVEHVGLVEIDANCCKTLRFNRPNWNVIKADLREFDAADFKGVDLVSGGLPCPPFSVAGKQLGDTDERNLFPAAIRIIEQVRPRAVMIENVRGILDAVFEDFRNFIRGELGRLGYWCDWRLLTASDYGVPQLRPRVVFVAIREDEYGHFRWPLPSETKPPTVGEKLYDLMAEKGWCGAKLWAGRANESRPQ